MKIAAVTDDGSTISQHFGRAQYYLVATVEDGQIIARELREKVGHVQFSNESHDDNVAGQPHGYGAAADHRHARMAATITDCEAVLCRGMGRGAYENLKSHNIRPVVTVIESIDEALLAYANGSIIDRSDLLH